MPVVIVYLSSAWAVMALALAEKQEHPRSNPIYLVRPLASAVVMPVWNQIQTANHLPKEPVAAVQIFAVAVVVAVQFLASFQAVAVTTQPAAAELVVELAVVLAALRRGQTPVVSVLVALTCQMDQRVAVLELAAEPAAEPAAELVQMDQMAAALAAAGVAAVSVVVLRLHIRTRIRCRLAVSLELVLTLFLSPLA